MHEIALRDQVKYIATIEHVREVALTGSADLTYWTSRLAREGLFPWNDAGRAEMLIGVPRLTWMGWRFCELSIAVRVSHRKDGSTDDGVFLVYAFNTSRTLAFLERNWFSTPYYHARVMLEEKAPCRFSLLDGDETVIRASMGIIERESITRDEAWLGTLYLPHAAAKPKFGWQLFHAKIAGLTTISPFVAGVDTFEVRPSRRHAPLDCLTEAGFTPHEWHVRHDAIHARSKTYRRER